MALKRISQEEIDQLLAYAKTIPFTCEDKQRQIESFAYGNVALHNPAVTKEAIHEAAEELFTTTRRVPVDVLQDVYMLLEDIEWADTEGTCLRCLAQQYVNEKHHPKCFLALTKEKLKEYLR